MVIIYIIPEIGVKIQQTVRKRKNRKRPVSVLFSVQLVENLETKTTYTSLFALMSCTKHFALMFCGTASLALFQNQSFYSYKMV